MSHCIYCRAETSGTESRAHAIPEAIAQNEFTLPRGTICDPCNGYLSELDTALILHRQVWLAIQALGLPGKKGKARRELGWMKRKKPDRSSSVTIEGKGKNKLFMDGNHIRIEKSEAPGWNLKRFRRSLHYIASQLGMKKNDFLRQAVSYEYPRHHWEKDNFAIRPEYKDLIKEVLEELKEK